MSELNELYQEVILDHNRMPRNFKEMDHPTHKADGVNPLCGDKLTVFLRIGNDRIDDISFVGSGCAISKASASMMTDKVKGLSVLEAEKVFEFVHRVLTGKEKSTEVMDKLGNLASLAGISEFPMRVKCATLAWHAMHAAMESQDGEATTE